MTFTGGMPSKRTLSPALMPYRFDKPPLISRTNWLGAPTEHGSNENGTVCSTMPTIFALAADKNHVQRERRVLHPE